MWRLTVPSPADEMLVRFAAGGKCRLSLAPAGRAPDLVAAGFLHFADCGRGCFQLPPAGTFGCLSQFAPDRAGGGRLPWRERRVLTSDESTGHALTHMLNTPLHYPLESVDTDLSLRGDRKPRLLTTGFALGDEIFISTCSERKNEKDETQSKGRCFHDRSFRRKYQENDGPISLAWRFGTATNWHVHQKARCRFQVRNPGLMRADYALMNKESFTP